MVAATAFFSDDMIALVSADTSLLRSRLLLGWFRSASDSATPKALASQLIARNHSGMLLLCSMRI